LIKINGAFPLNVIDPSASTETVGVFFRMSVAVPPVAVIFAAALTRKPSGVFYISFFVEVTVIDRRKFVSLISTRLSIFKRFDAVVTDIFCADGWYPIKLNFSR
jgi:hypothetical protein